MGATPVVCTVLVCLVNLALLGRNAIATAAPRTSAPPRQQQHSHLRNATASESRATSTSSSRGAAGTIFGPSNPFLYWTDYPGSPDYATRRPAWCDAINNISHVPMHQCSERLLIIACAAVRRVRGRFDAIETRSGSSFLTETGETIQVNGADRSALHVAAIDHRRGC